MAVDLQNVPASKMSMHELLQLCVEKGASDLHIAVGRPPTLRMDGRLESIGVQVLGPKDSND